MGAAAGPRRADRELEAAAIAAAARPPVADQVEDVAAELGVELDDTHGRYPDAMGHDSDRDTERPSITCPKCGRTSWHPKDVEYGWCGACQAFTTERPNLPPRVAARANEGRVPFDPDALPRA